MIPFSSDKPQVHPLDSSLFIGCGPAWGLVAWTRWSLPPKMLTTRWMSNTVTAKMAAKLPSPLFPFFCFFSPCHSLSNSSTKNRIGGKFWLPFVLNWFWFWSLSLNLVWILICVWFELRCLVSIGYGGWFPSIYSWGWQWLGLDNSLGVSYGGSSWYNAESGNVYLNENSINK